DYLETCARTHLSTTRLVLRKLVREASRHETEDRIFSAVLGKSLRLGALDALLCAPESDKAYRVFIHQTRLDRFDRGLVAARPHSCVLLRPTWSTDRSGLEVCSKGSRRASNFHRHIRFVRISVAGLGSAGSRRTRLDRGKNRPRWRHWRDAI